MKEQITTLEQLAKKQTYSWIISGLIAAVVIGGILTAIVLDNQEKKVIVQKASVVKKENSDLVKTNKNLEVKLQQSIASNDIYKSPVYLDLKREVANQDVQLASFQEKIISANEAVASKSAAINELENGISNRDKEIARLRKSVAEGSDLPTPLLSNEEIKVLQNKLSDLENQSNNDDQIEDYKKQLAEAVSAKQEAERGKENAIDRAEKANRERNRLRKILGNPISPSVLIVEVSKPIRTVELEKNLRGNKNLVYVQGAFGGANGRISNDYNYIITYSNISEEVVMNTVKYLESRGKKVQVVNNDKIGGIKNHVMVYKQ